MTSVKPMPRYTRLPLTLFRIQPHLPVALRDYDTQVAKGRQSFDLKLHSGMIMPIAKDGPFEGPNGMSLRPVGEKMIEILEGFKGEPRIFTLEKGLVLPELFAIYHEHSDHYSMQPTKPISLSDYNKALTAFLKTLPSVSRDEFLAQLDELNDQNN